MRIKKSILFLTSMTLFFTCHTEKNKIAKSVSLSQKKIISKNLKAELILDQTINAHGGHLYTNASYAFLFRGDTYQFKHDDKNYEYLKKSKKGNSLTKDLLKNGTLTRVINEDTITVSKEHTQRISSAINSVVYFATLPYKLNDDAVNKAYIGETVIKGESYYILGITFNPEGGGADFEDQFYYWINTKTKKIDYLAYTYNVNKGGVRFRSAYNRRVINGITFQDYINYKAELGTPLKALPNLYETGKLKELSKIKTENIINLNNK